MSTHLTTGQKALIETALYLRGDTLRRRLAQREDFNDGAEMAIADAENLELARIESAIDRLADGDFGTCSDCGGRISFDDLRSRPHATYCATCAAARRKRAGRSRIIASAPASSPIRSGAP